MLFIGKNIAEFNLTELLAVSLLVVRKHVEVEDGGAVIGFDENGDVADVGEETLIFDDVVHVRNNMMDGQS